MKYLIIFLLLVTTNAYSSEIYKINQEKIEKERERLGLNIMDQLGLRGGPSKNYRLCHDYGKNCSLLSVKEKKFLIAQYKLALFSMVLTINSVTNPDKRVESMGINFLTSLCLKLYIFDDTSTECDQAIEIIGKYNKK